MVLLCYGRQLKSNYFEWDWWTSGFGCWCLQPGPHVQNTSKHYISTFCIKEQHLHPQTFHDRSYKPSKTELKPKRLIWGSSLLKIIINDLIVFLFSNTFKQWSHNVMCYKVYLFSPLFVFGPAATQSDSLSTIDLLRFFSLLLGKRRTEVFEMLFSHALCSQTEVVSAPAVSASVSPELPLLCIFRKASAFDIKLL